jgi:hypothetical protein
MRGASDGDSEFQPFHLNINIITTLWLRLYFVFHETFFITDCMNSHLLFKRDPGRKSRKVESSSEVPTPLSDLCISVCACVAQMLWNCMFAHIVIVSVHASIEALMMLSDDVDIQKSPVRSNALQFSDNIPSSKLQTKKLNIPELPLKAKPRKEVRRGGLPVSSFAQKPQATVGYED